MREELAWAWKHAELIRKRWKGKLVVKGLIARRTRGSRARVQRALTLLRDEVDRDMALLGIRSIGEITSDLVRRL